MSPATNYHIAENDAVGYKKFIDGFILSFNPYNRNILKLAELPKDFKYQLRADCICGIDCNFRTVCNNTSCSSRMSNGRYGGFDWEGSCQIYKLKERYKNGTISKEYYDWHIAKIPPQDLVLFDKYIDSYLIGYPHQFSYDISDNLNSYVNPPNDPINYNWYKLPESEDK